MISAVDEIDSVIRCIELGAEDYLPKPFNPTLLRARVGACLERKRLHDQVTARTRELSEALEQQTATSEVLQVISQLARRAGAGVRGHAGERDAHLRGQVRHPVPLRRRRSFDIAAHAQRAACVAWRPRRTTADPSASGHRPRPRRADKAGRPHRGPHDAAGLPRTRSVRSLRRRARRRTAPSLVVPMLKEDELIGAIVIYRQEVRPFTDKQIELVQNFAAQAVIAIENTRLLNELRRDRCSSRPRPPRCCRSSRSSPGDLEPVFEAMLENATRICEAKFGILWLREGDALPHRRAARRAARLCRVQTARRRVHARPGTAPRPRACHAKQSSTLPICTQEPAYTSAILRVALVELAGARTVLVVPMLKEDELIGAITIYRQEVRPFTDKQIELVRTSPPRPSSPSRTRACSTSCANSLQQQTATAEVLKVISQLARRPGAGVRGHAGERNAHLRGQVRHAVPAAKEMLSARSRCTARRRQLTSSRQREPGCRRTGDAPLDRVMQDQAGGPHR